MRCFHGRDGLRAVRIWSFADFQAFFGNLKDARPTLWCGRPRPHLLMSLRYKSSTKPARENKEAKANEMDRHDDRSKTPKSASAPKLPLPVPTRKQIIRRQ